MCIHILPFLFYELKFSLKYFFYFFYLIYKLIKIILFGLNEAADFLKIHNGKNVRYDESNSYPFCYMDGKFITGKRAQSHTETLIDYFKNNGNESTEHYIDGQMEAWDYVTFDGRLWLDYDVISFWGINRSKDIDKVVEIINKLENELDININKNVWLIDFADMSDRKSFSLSIQDFIDKDYTNARYATISKQEIDELKRLHMMSPIEKEKYYKSHPDKRPIKNTHKDKPLAWKQAIMRSESIISYENFGLIEKNKNNIMTNIIKSFDQFNSINEAKKIEIKDDEIRKIYELLKDFHEKLADGKTYTSIEKLATLKNGTKRIARTLIDKEIGLIKKEGKYFVENSNRVPTPAKIKALLKENKKRNRNESENKVEYRTGLVYDLLMTIFKEFKKLSFRPLSHDKMLVILEDFNKNNSNKLDINVILYLFTTAAPMSRDVEYDGKVQLLYRWDKKQKEPTKALAKKLYKASYEKESSFDKEMRKEEEKNLASKMYKLNNEINKASSRIKKLSAKSEESNKKREEERYKKLLFGSKK